MAYTNQIAIHNLENFFIVAYSRGGP